jgi:hypothetical protein
MTLTIKFADGEIRVLPRVVAFELTPNGGTITRWYAIPPRPMRGEETTIITCTRPLIWKLEVA